MCKTSYSLWPRVAEAIGSLKMLEWPKPRCGPSPFSLLLSLLLKDLNFTFYLLYMYIVYLIQRRKLNNQLLRSLSPPVIVFYDDRSKAIFLLWFLLFYILVLIFCAVCILSIVRFNNLVKFR